MAQHSVELDALQTKTTQLENKVTYLQKEQSKRTAAINRLQTEVDKHTTTNNDLRIQVEQSTAECQQLKKELAHATSEAKSNKKKIEELLNCNVVLEDRVIQLYRLKKTKGELRGHASARIRLLKHMLQETQSRLDLYT